MLLIIRILFGLGRQHDDGLSPLSTLSLTAS